jgi:LysR family transcriptional regulator, regulator of abg operon
MKLHQFDALVAVVDHGGIRAAARALNVSQAAVTKSMKQLEGEAGVPLLIRRARGVALTDAGHRLLARARVITRQVTLAREDIQQAGGDDAGTLRVGLTPFLNFTALGETFMWFRQRYRNVQLQLIEGLMMRVLPKLRDGTLDMAAVAADVGELEGEEFVVRRLLRAPQRIVVRDGHPVLKDPDARALTALEWVLTQPIAGATQPRIAAMFAMAGVAPPSRVVVCETLAAMSILRHSDAVSIFPEPLLGHPETRGIVAIADAPFSPSDIELLLLTQPDVPMTAAAEHFAHCLASVCGGKLEARAFSAAGSL